MRDGQRTEGLHIYQSWWHNFEDLNSGALYPSAYQVEYARGMIQRGIWSVAEARVWLVGR